MTMEKHNRDRGSRLSSMHATTCDLSYRDTLSRHAVIGPRSQDAHDLEICAATVAQLWTCVFTVIKYAPRWNLAHDSGNLT